MCRATNQRGGPQRCSADTRKQFQAAVATLARLETEAVMRHNRTLRRPVAEPIPADAITAGLQVAEMNNPNRTGCVIEVREIAVNQGGPEFRFALVELDNVKAFGQPVRHLYLVDSLRYPAG